MVATMAHRSFRRNFCPRTAVCPCRPPAEGTGDLVALKRLFEMLAQEGVARPLNALESPAELVVQKFGDHLSDERALARADDQ